MVKRRALGKRLFVRKRRKLGVRDAVDIQAGGGQKTQ